MFNPMSEMSLQYLLGGMSLIAAIAPITILLAQLRKQLFARRYEMVDPDGEVMFEISAESVQRAKPDDIARLRERIRQKHDITIRAA